MKERHGAPSNLAKTLVRANGDAMVKPSKELVTKVRVAVTEIMSKDEILKLLEQRVLDEVRGKIERGDTLRVTPIMLKIAAETWSTAAPQPREGAKHLHFHGWTGEQMLEFAKTGKRPVLEKAS